MSRTWVIRGGEGNRLVDVFIDNGVIGVGYPQIGDGQLVEEQEVAAVLRADGRTVPERRANRFESFVRGVEIGDTVLMPDTPRGEIVLGEVTGDYEFHGDLPADQYRHRRRVEWITRAPIETLPAARQHLYKQRETLCEVPTTEVEDFVVDALSHEPRRDARGQARGTGARRPDVTRNDEASTYHLCPGCHLQKHWAQFDAGANVCRDCT